MLHTKFKSSRLCAFREEDFFDVLPIISLKQIMTPLDFPSLDHWDMVGRIHKKTTRSQCFTQNIKSSWPCCFRDKYFSYLDLPL